MTFIIVLAENDVLVQGGYPFARGLDDGHRKCDVNMVLRDWSSGRLGHGLPVVFVSSYLNLARRRSTEEHPIGLHCGWLQVPAKSVRDDLSSKISTGDRMKAIHDSQCFFTPLLPYNEIRF